MVNLNTARDRLYELADDRDLATRIAGAMAKMGHRWHDTPKDRTPTVDEVNSLMGYLCGEMIRALTDHPEVDRQRVGTGGIHVHYWRWTHGAEEVELRYSPEGLSSSWS